MTKPITPAEIADKKAESIPAFVIDAFNTLIALNYEGGSSSFTQDAVVAAIMSHSDKPKSLTREQIFERNWLDVEPLFSDAGWAVVYDKPAYCEDYPATFTFTKRGS